MELKLAMLGVSDRLYSFAVPKVNTVSPPLSGHHGTGQCPELRNVRNSESFVDLLKVCVPHNTTLLCVRRIAAGANVRFYFFSFLPNIANCGLGNIKSLCNQSLGHSIYFVFGKKGKREKLHIHDIHKRQLLS